MEKWFTTAPHSIQDCFQAIDHDGNGVLDKQEIIFAVQDATIVDIIRTEGALAPLLTPAIFAQFIHGLFSNEKGSVVFTEFERAVLRIGAAGREHTAAAAIQARIRGVQTRQRQQQEQQPEHPTNANESVVATTLPSYRDRVVAACFCTASHTNLIKCGSRACPMNVRS